MQAIYTKLKVASTPAQSAPLLLAAKALLFSPTATEPIDPILAREILELGLLNALGPPSSMADFSAYYTLLLPYYTNTALVPSQRMYTVIGLNLLRLLAENKIAAFHSVLETLDTDVLKDNIYIKHPVHIEQCLMEGSYNRVWNARGNVPAKEYTIFIDILMATIR
jgi:26S proteasome regulatory subunit N12